MGKISRSCRANIPRPMVPGGQRRDNHRWGQEGALRPLQNAAAERVMAKRLTLAEIELRCSPLFDQRELRQTVTAWSGVGVTSRFRGTADACWSEVEAAIAGGFRL